LDQVIKLWDFRDQGVTVTSDNVKAIEGAQIILLALKPHLRLKEQVLVSLATGITIEQLETVVGGSIPIFRAMPNTAADVNQSLTCICSNTDDETTYAWIESLFSEIGKTQRIEEKLMEAATVLGACGIAYVLRFIRAMVQGGIQIGFDAETASFIVNQTVMGASQLLI